MTRKWDAQFLPTEPPVFSTLPSHCAHHLPARPTTSGMLSTQCNNKPLNITLHKRRLPPIGAHPRQFGFCWWERKANFNLKKLIISMFQTGQAEMPESLGRARIKGTMWLVPLQLVGAGVIQGMTLDRESGDSRSQGPSPTSWCCREKHASQR